MSKRKIMMMAMALCMVAILAVGGSLAYFTAEGGADNVFTMGGVDIELEEDFEEDPELKPGLDINKDVWVNNTGDSDAYVRVHIAIPTSMDDGDPSFDASKNFLHFNFTKESIQDGQWSWKDADSEGLGYEGGMKDWNFYQMDLYDEELGYDIAYNIYVVTYRTALKPGEQTATQALDKVYLDATVNAVVNKDADGNITGYTYTDTKGNTVTLTKDEAKTIKVKVWAEGTQTDPFTSAYDALDAAFGVPGTYNPWAE